LTEGVETMASSAKTVKGFKVLCPKCGDPEATIRLDLNNLQEVECSSCSETFSARQAVKDAAENARRWEAVARWIDMSGEALAADDGSD
jgi:Zn ribbon nucleic-acid-binding protein